MKAQLQWLFSAKRRAAVFEDRAAADSTFCLCYAWCAQRVTRRSCPQLARLNSLSLSMLLVNPLTVSAAVPSIDFQPKDQTVILYQPAAFGVIASGTAPLSYQWRKDGVPIAGATDDQIVLAHPQFSAAGLYSVVVSNAEGSLTNADVTLTVNTQKGGDL